MPIGSYKIRAPIARTLHRTPFWSTLFNSRSDTGKMLGKMVHFPICFAKSMFKHGAFLKWRNTPKSSFWDKNRFLPVRFSQHKLTIIYLSVHLGVPLFMETPMCPNPSHCFQGALGPPAPAGRWEAGSSPWPLPHHRPPPSMELRQKPLVFNGFYVLMMF